MGQSFLVWGERELLRMELSIPLLCLLPVSPRFSHACLVIALSLLLMYRSFIVCFLFRRDGLASPVYLSLCVGLSS